MKWIVFVIMLLCAMGSVAAATVSIGNSGITRGSREYTFMYSATDPEPTVVKDVLMNDVIAIVYGRTTMGQELKKEYFFKSITGTTWSYEVIRGEKGLTIKVGEKVPLDLNADKQPELMMELTTLVNKKGTLTFTLPGAASVTPPNTTQPATPPTPPAPVLTPEPATPPATPPPAAQPSPSPPTAPPVSPDATPSAPAKSSAWIYLVMVGLVAVALFIYFLPKGGQRGKKPKEAAKKDTEEESDEDAGKDSFESVSDAEESAPKLQKHEIVSASASRESLRRRR
jgi:hypothetical protein